MSARLLQAGNSFSEKRGLRLEVLWPRRNPDGSLYQIGSKDHPNESSVEILLTYGDYRALFTGDGEANILSQLRIPDISVLKVSHQGSQGGLTEANLEKIKPELAVISVGENK